MRIAFMGFRHGHIMGLYNAVQSHPATQLVAACEEDPANAIGGGKVQITHTRFADVLANVQCDTIAVGDYFAKRGRVIIEALKAGKHVIADKPVCTKLSELEEIARLTREKKLKLGCLLDLRDAGVFRTTRRLIQSGEIGDVLTVTFTAQHPLLLATRPKWYLEEGKHRGTINDIGIHAIDLLPWLTGRRLTSAVAARTWNARVPDAPHFHDGGQLLLKLDNGGGIMGDVSYFSPDGLAYTAPQYWRVLIHGSKGMIEASYSQRTVTLARDEDKTPRSIEVESDVPNGCLEAFLREVAGDASPDSLKTADVLDASRRTLLIQQAADQNQTNLSLD